MIYHRLAIQARLPLILFASLQVLSAASPGYAAKPSQDLLPAATKFSWSMANQQEFSDRFSTTELGKLLSDPAMYGDREPDLVQRVFVASRVH